MPTMFTTRVEIDPEVVLISPEATEAIVLEALEVSGAGAVALK